MSSLLKLIPSDAMFSLRGFVADKWQSDFIQGYLETDKDQLLLSVRRSGKSSVLAAIAAREMLLTPDFQVALVSPSQNQGNEIAREIQMFLDCGGR